MQAGQVQLVTIAADTMTVRASGELVDGELRDLPRYTPEGQLITGAVVLAR